MFRVRVSPSTGVARSLAASLLVSLLASDAAAQTVSGRITFSGGTPAVDVQIVAVRADGSPLAARTLTNSGGQFVLSVPPAPVILRAHRIGFVPEEIARLTLAPSDRRDITFELRGERVQLAPVLTSTTSRCTPVSQLAPAMLAVIQDLRDALSATQLVSAAGATQSRVVLEDLVTSSQGVPLRDTDRRLVMGTSARPFQSIDPAILRRTGYVITTPSETEYRAPDSRVLASDEFLADHCFGLSTDTAVGPEWLGVTFAPAEAPRGIVGIAGTFWIDRATRELHHMSFHYVGLPRALRSAPLGGEIDFAHLADGTWFEQRWTLRMPRTSFRSAQVDPRDAPIIGGELAVDALQVIGGEVVEMRRGTQLIFASNQRLINDVLARQTSAGAQTPVQGIPESIAAVCGEPIPGERAHSVLVGDVFDRAPIRVQRALVLATWRDHATKDSLGQWTWNERSLTFEADDYGKFKWCGAPIEQPITVVAMHDNRMSPAVTVHLSNRSPLASVTLALHNAATGDIPLRATEVRVADSAGAPIAHAFVALGKEIHRVADADGVASLPVAGAAEFSLRVSRVGFATFDSTVARSANGDVHITLQPAGAAFATDTVLARTGFYDRVHRAQRGAFIAEFYPPERIAEQSNISLTELVRGRFGLSVVFPDDESEDMAFAGRAKCAVPLLVDEQPLSLIPKTYRAVGARVGEQVLAIELYERASDVPAELGSQLRSASCSALVIWSTKYPSR